MKRINAFLSRKWPCDKIHIKYANAKNPTVTILAKQSLDGY